MSGAVEGRSSLSSAAVARRALASAASLGIAAVLFRALWSGAAQMHGWTWLAPCALVAAPVVAGVAIWSRFIALQLLARAFWWVQLLFVTFASVSGVADRRVVALAIGSACALLSAGRLGLDGGGRFRPVAFRGTLMLALVLAIADAGTFSWLGLLQTIEDGKMRFILFAPPMIAAVIGLLRLRTWGLLISVVSNVLVAVLIGARVFEVSDPIRTLFVAMAIVQLLIPLPMWVTILRRRPAPPDRWPRAKALAATCVIVCLVLALAAVSVIATLGRVPYDAP